MGSYSSIFEKTKEESKIVLLPSKGDFITTHADLTGLAVVEVQRFWGRFNQLGCDKNGNLPKRSIERGELIQDAFIKNIMANLPKEKDGSLSFLVYLKFMHWLESAEEEMKLRVIFHFLNNGNDLDADIIDKLLKKVYPSNTNDEVKATTDSLMKQLDTKGTGRINETQFITNIVRNYSDHQLASILRFDLIPNEVLDDANMQPSLAGSQMNLMSDRNIDLKSELDDQTLEIVATKAIKKDWEKLALKLGFLESDIKSLKARHNSSSYETLVDMLYQWRDQDPYLATKNRLRAYLEETNMPEAAAVLRK